MKLQNSNDLFLILISRLTGIFYSLPKLSTEHLLLCIDASMRVREHCICTETFNICIYSNIQHFIGKLAYFLKKQCARCTTLNAQSELTITLLNLIFCRPYRNYYTVLKKREHLGWLQIFSLSQQSSTSPGQPRALRKQNKVKQKQLKCSTQNGH